LTPIYNLVALDADGTQKWVFPTGKQSSSIAAFAANGAFAVGADGTIYMGSFDNNLYAINPDGTERWVVETGGTVTSAPAIGADGTVYFGSADNNLYAIGP
jgi:outer membrane protein assembly factor BamB